MNWMMSLQVGGFVIAWLARSSIDGRITGKELVELIDGVAKMCDIKLEFEVPDDMQPSGKVGQAIQAAGAVAGMASMGSQISHPTG